MAKYGVGQKPRMPRYSSKSGGVSDAARALKNKLDKIVNVTSSEHCKLLTFKQNTGILSSSQNTPNSSYSQKGCNRNMGKKHIFCAQHDLTTI